MFRTFRKQPWCDRVCLTGMQKGGLALAALNDGWPRSGSDRASGPACESRLFATQREMKSKVSSASKFVAAYWIGRSQVENSGNLDNFLVF